MFLSPIQRLPGHSQVHNQAKIVIKKKRRSLRIFSAHITTKAIEMEFSAPLLSRAIIKSSEYFLSLLIESTLTPRFASAGLRLAAACEQH